MSGEEQHFDPCFLLKGFTFDTRRKKVWYFHMDRTPTPERTQDIGKDYLFYGNSGPGTLDHNITEKENEYARIVEGVRKEKKIDLSVKDTLVEFVYLQGMRTKVARELYHQILITVAKDGLQKYGTVEGITNFLQDVIDPNDKKFQRQFMTGVRKHGLNPSYLKMQISSCFTNLSS